MRLVAVHPTIAGNAAQRCATALAETEAMVARAARETVARRGNYWRIGHNLLQNDQHWHEHVDQIEGCAAPSTKRERSEARTHRQL